MSENVRVVERVIDAINRADLDAVVDGSTDDFELDFSNSRGPMSAVYPGAEGIREFFGAFFEVWASAEFKLEEMIELSADRVLSVGTIHTRGHGSGIDVSARGANVWTIRDGKVAAVTMYQSKQEALEAASAER